MYATNCPNCGATITGEKCQYCGTVFFDNTPVEEYEEVILGKMELVGYKCPSCGKYIKKATEKCSCGLVLAWANISNRPFFT